MTTVLLLPFLTVLFLFFLLLIENASIKIYLRAAVSATIQEWQTQPYAAGLRALHKASLSTESLGKLKLAAQKNFFKIRGSVQRAFVVACKNTLMWLQYSSTFSCSSNKQQKHTVCKIERLCAERLTKVSECVYSTIQTNVALFFSVQ